MNKAEHELWLEREHRQAMDTLRARRESLEKERYVVALNALNGDHDTAQRVLSALGRFFR